MSNISRRKFLKGAGVAALAVAAAGVLAGCSNQDVIDAVTTEKVDVIFHDAETGDTFVDGVQIEAKKGDVIGTKDIEPKLPNGYMIAVENDNLEVDWDKTCVTVEVCEAQDVTFQFLNADSGAQVGEDVKVKIPKSKTSVTVAEVEKYAGTPEGYSIVALPATKPVKNGVVQVAVIAK